MLTEIYVTEKYPDLTQVTTRSQLQLNYLDDFLLEINFARRKNRT